MDSFRFAEPLLLWLLLLLPVLALMRSRSGAAPALIFSSVSAVKAIADSRKVSPGRLLAWLRLAAVGLLIIGMAKPQWGRINTDVEASGIDILLAVDISGSMKALDFTLQGKQVNRLDVVKSVVAKFINERPNDRIGLVAFAGRPYMVCPLTLDHDWLRLRLNSLRIGMIEDGTAIGSAIISGVNRLRDQAAKSRILILLTDGVNNAGKAAPLTAAEAAAAMKIKAYTIGVGKRGVAEMPVEDMFGRPRMIQAEVNIDEETLTKVATLTGAKYFRATDTDSLEKIYTEINALETTVRKIRHFSQHRELFAWPVLVALFLLAVELVLSRKKLP
ncbi:MAG: Ca-activated chloride channel family protein [Candidatus Electronema aureum]|uniref:Ca-activated chloride channel family protein n=1 Tax=Candidatus Electronema aureum TaxID=2005002 RepID=A0A521G1S5_9BACT|nr:MAG: Ca-activated chloride channel family protein [Candidatus Electronema aureum]